MCIGKLTIIVKLVHVKRVFWSKYERATRVVYLSVIGLHQMYEAQLFGDTGQSDYRMQKNFNTWYN